MKVLARCEDNGWGQVEHDGWHFSICTCNKTDEQVFALLRSSVLVASKEAPREPA